jgi:hypothetical protein
VTINLTKPMREWVAEQAEARGFKDEQAFLQQLIKEEKKRLAVDKLVKKLETAEASGFVEWTKDSLRQAKERLRNNLHAIKTRKPK